MSVSVNLRHKFGDFTLDAAFEAPLGVTALFGHSGSGKTTLVNAVAGLLRPDWGQVTVAGTVLQDSTKRLWTPPHRRGIGYVFQDARLFPHMSVAQNLGYGRRVLRTEDSAEFERIVALLGIGALMQRRPHTLSGGEAARVAIGRALLSRPRLLLMDEPLAALDAPRRAEILPYLERLRDEVQVPILYVSHAATEVARLATFVVVMQAGRVLRAGPMSEILSDPELAPAFGRHDEGAVLAARVAAHHGDGLSELRVSGGALFLPDIAAKPGAQLRIRIPAQDVILSRERPRGLSALNILAAEVVQVQEGAGPSTLVQLRAGDDLILARITRRSVQALGLAPGVACFAVIKSVAVAQGNLEREAP